MGPLTLPASGLVYIDTMTLIYTVERYPAYYPFDVGFRGVAGLPLVILDDLLTP